MQMNSAISAMLDGGARTCVIEWSETCTRRWQVSRMYTLPDGSLYFWFYEMGLKHVPWSDVVSAVHAAGRQIRMKDRSNYWNGWNNAAPSSYDSDPYLIRDRRELVTPVRSFATMRYEDYPEGIELWQRTDRWVPIDENIKPLVKWSEVRMGIDEARATPGCVYVSENLKGTNLIVIDCDGDHGSSLDLDTVKFLRRWSNHTHCMDKPKLVCEYEGYEDSGLTIPASFHLMFKTDRVIPTMHFTHCHIDVLGNKTNVLRCRKNKIWNRIQPAEMTSEIWEELKQYVESKKIPTAIQ